MKSDLLKADVKKLFFRYFIPSVMGVLSVSSYIFFDTVFIGKGVGSNGLSALNVVLPIYNIFSAVGLLFGMGGATVLSICRGKKDEDTATKVFSYSVILSLIVGLIITVVGSMFLDNVAMLLGANEENIFLVEEYLRIIMIMPIGFIMTNVFNIFVRNDGSPRLAMVSMIISSFVNIVFDYILVFPMDMGMKGAAIATFISPVVGIIIISSHFFTKGCRLKLVFQSIDINIIKRVVANGAPSFIMEISAGIVIFAFNSAIFKYLGNMGIAAYGIIANIGIIFVSIFNGIAQAAQPIISINHGAGFKNRVYEILRISQVTALFFGFVFFALGMLFPEFLISMFNNDIALISVTKRGIYLYFVAFIVMGINVTNTMYFQSIEEFKTSTAMSILRGVGGIIIGLFILPLFIGVDGVWITVPVAEALTFIFGISVIMKNKQKWAKENLTI